MTLREKLELGDVEALTRDDVWTDDITAVFDFTRRHTDERNLSLREKEAELMPDVVRACEEARIEWATDQSTKTLNEMMAYPSVPFTFAFSELLDFEKHGLPAFQDRGGAPFVRCVLEKFRDRLVAQGRAHVGVKLADQER